MQSAVPLACFFSMIRPPGVLFEQGLLQIAPVNKIKCPYVKENVDIGFQLFTRHNPTVYQPLAIDDDEKLFASNVDFHVPTVIYFGAFLEQPDEGSGLMVREAYMLRGDTNMIMVDARTLEAGPWYITAAENTWYIGQFVARFIDYLVSRGLNLNNTHLIGHSLGAQAAGVAGSALKSGRVSRITGLDPAFPLFDKLPLDQRLDPSDADLVDVIHTDAGIFGFNRNMGHADFYPNGGISPQPGCELEVVLHQPIITKKCDGQTRQPEGFYRFYLQTNNKKDFRSKLYEFFIHIHNLKDNIEKQNKDFTQKFDIYDENTEISVVYGTKHTKKRLHVSKTITDNVKGRILLNKLNRDTNNTNCNQTDEVNNNTAFKTEHSTKETAGEGNQNIPIAISLENNLNKSLTLTLDKLSDPDKVEENHKTNIGQKPLEQSIKGTKGKGNENIPTAISHENNFDKLVTSKHDINLSNSDKVENKHTITDNVEKSMENIRNNTPNTELATDNERMKTEKVKKTHENNKSKKRQKRFVPFLQKSEAAENDNLLMRMLEFLFKYRKNVLPVISVMREINTLIKSGNGELNHITKERNNYIGTSPVLPPIASYTLELGGEGKVTAFVKRLLGISPKGDRLTIAGGK
ncbi:uncharacterized protein LOC128682510 isoform X1 [Plodia interpunctella]|uniref:uncharacterized protein LOC128682510 isoform X1 n=1 Tax=Plodia interpunctella TaxID=58824 RepID=UPI002368D588|nr:uncharacterized protein LOC128682510 isoform X1 [Plodia interpunctella]